MIHRMAIYLTVIFSFLCNAAESASFDCSKASSTIEHSICDNPRLSGLDSDLVNVYKQALASSTNPDALKIEQRVWLTQQRNKCSDVMCLQSEYSKRINALSSVSHTDSSTAEPANANANVAATNAPPQPLTGATEKPFAIAQSKAQESESSVEKLFDPKNFEMGWSEGGEYSWSRRSKVIYGKSVLDWTDADFIVLERKLKEQLILAKKGMESTFAPNGKSAQGYSLFEAHAKYLQQAIDEIPKLPGYIAIGKEKEAKERVEKEKVKIAEDVRIAKRAQDDKVIAERQRSESLKEDFYILLAIICGAWVWHKFMRRRCPSCKATSPELLNKNELESWLGTKEVSESLGNGQSRKRTVNTTFSKVSRVFECTKCGNKWEEISKEEK